jgi:hypothetical protein
MAAAMPNETAGVRWLWWVWPSLCLIVVSCYLQPEIPIVSDDAVEVLLRSEAAPIVAVNEDRRNFANYVFLLSEFPRQDILGMSVGGRRIYISYELASGALTDSTYLWLLRRPSVN